MPIISKKIKPEFSDTRGDILKLLDDGKTKIRSVLWITCKKGSIRANHVHKKDSHYCYLVSGKMLYVEKPWGKSGKKKSWILNAGALFYTPPKVIHVMKFLKDSVFLTLATRSRHQFAYEKDLIRVKLI